MLRAHVVSFGLPATIPHRLPAAELGGDLLVHEMGDIIPPALDALQAGS